MQKKPRSIRSYLLPIALVIIGLILLQSFLTNRSQDITYNQFEERLTNNPESITQVDIDTGKNTLTLLSEPEGPRQLVQKETTGYLPNTEEELLATLQKEDITTTIKGAGGSFFSTALVFILPMILFLAFWIFIIRQMSGGAQGAMKFGNSKARRHDPSQPKITFKDVAGADEAVEEVHEIKDFLANPNKYKKIGARIPKGVLFYGPPGTGKTLLARAIAGEAGVPFYSISGSDFVEMFVGVGASRVRDLFNQAKKEAPAIIFIDEIDAVGRHRGAGVGGGNDEREQTLNQLLVEMDGFEGEETIIVIAGTNRPDVLDPALLRPGRFDRQITIDRPDRKGRRDILKVHSRGKPLASQIDLDALAGQTPGFTGADLANLINEAALLSARRGGIEIEMQDLEEGIMRVIAGPEKKSRIMSEKERRVTAYHELGHAIVGHVLPEADPVHKVSVVSRGQALGYTISMPEEDKFLTSREELEDTMAMTLGGRAAEELVFGNRTSGASNDLQKVTQTAKQMIMRFGMSDKLGPRVFGHDASQPFLGREFSNEPDYSEKVADLIDEEVHRVIEEAHKKAMKILKEHREELDYITDILLRRETIDAEHFAMLLNGQKEEDVFPDDKEDKEEDKPKKPKKEDKESKGTLPLIPPISGQRGVQGAQMKKND